MATIFLKGEDGSLAPFDEQQIPSLLASRIISPQTLYWQEGMEDWQPLSLWLASEKNPAPAKPPTQAKATG